MKKYLLAFGLLLVMGGCGVKEGQKIEETSNYKIGVIVPLSGPATVYGNDVQRGLKDMGEMVNAQGGIQRKAIEFIWEDGKCNPNDASKAAQKLVNIDKVKIIMGVPCSGESLSVAPITEKAKVILITNLSKASAISDAGEYLFRFAVPTKVHSGLVADFLNQKKESVAVITQQTDYAISVLQAFKEGYKGELIEESFMTGESDFKNILTRLKSKKVDWVYLNLQTREPVPLIVRQMNDLQWNPRLMLNEAAGQGLGELLESDELLKDREVYSAHFMLDTEKSPILQNFYIKAKEKYGDLPVPEAYFMAMESLKLLGKILNNLEDPFDTDAIQKALYATQNYAGILGDISIDPKGDLVLPTEGSGVKLVRFRGGEKGFELLAP